MKAARVVSFGGAENPTIVSDEITPEPKAGQIQVEVAAAAINPFDLKLMSGAYAEHVSVRPPYVPGGDFSGRITKVGEGVTEFTVGDRVYGTANAANGGSGSMARIAVANAKNSALKPVSLDDMHAAAIVLVGVSALQAIEDHIGLKAGQKILIQGGAGGIGSTAIQLAKFLGAYVVATARGSDTDFVRGLGADSVIDYATSDFRDTVRDADAVYDTVGGETSIRSLSVLKKGGILVSMLPVPAEAVAGASDVRVVSQGTITNTAHLTRLSTLIAEGAIKPQVGATYPLDQVKEAFIHAAGGVRGKIVVDTRE